MPSEQQQSLVNRFPGLSRLAHWQLPARIPVVRQLSATECGAAALAMVLGYYGKAVPVDELRNALGTGRDGTNASTILRVGRDHGLRGRGVSLEISEIKALPVGAILYWNFNHFVVYEKIKKGHVHIVDPAFGRRSVTLDKFRQAFTGVALVFEPTESFERRHGKSQKVFGLFGRVLQQKGLVTRIVSASLIVQILSAATPLLVGLVIDKVAPRKDYSLLAVLAIGYFVFQLFNVGIGYIRSYLLIYLRTRLEASFTLNFLDHLVDLPYSFFQQRTSGDLMVRLGSNSAVREILTSATLSAVLDGSTAVVYLILLLLIDVRLTLIAVFLALARFVILAMAWRRQRHLLAESLENQSQSQTYQVEMLSGMETLKAMGLEHRAALNWSNLFIEGLNISIKRGQLDALMTGLINLVAMANTLVFLFFATLLVLRGQLSLGTMMALSGLAAGFLGPLNNLVGAGLQMQMVGVYVQRLNDVMETATEQMPGPSLPCESLKGSISVQHVSFRYSKNEPLVINDVSFEIPVGSRIALVGRSGSGKSTLARLIAGLYDPIQGRILFDGNDLRTLDRRSARRQLGIVTQDTQLFGSSIRENIAFADPQMGLDRIIRAAKLAAVHDDIAAMPMAYETRLADRGLSLSGGQRQRLAIARALANRPSILIFDEATSHLDSMIEQQVNRNLASLLCTRIVIAHRLSTIWDADLILVLESGRVIEHGTHQQLLRTTGLYADLLTQQQNSDATAEHDADLSGRPY